MYIVINNVYNKIIYNIIYYNSDDITYTRGRSREYVLRDNVVRDIVLGRLRIGL